MPPLPPAPQTLKVSLAGTLGTTKWMNILHVKYTGTAPTGAQLNAYCSTVAAAWTSSLAALAGTGVTLTTVSAVDLTSATGATGSATVSNVGTRTGTQMTAQVAMVGTWLAPLRYRGGHFRQYWPFGTTTDQQTLATWTTAFKTAAGTGLNSFLTSINGATIGTASGVLGGLSYKTAHAFRPSPLFVPYSGAVVHGRIDTQRRRLGKEVP